VARERGRVCDNGSVLTSRPTASTYPCDYLIETGAGKKQSCSIAIKEGLIDYDV